ncbi:asparaginase, partial [Microvirga sp. 3-52]|nr:asparaginase [Microvirga sp. 3-52]
MKKIKILATGGTISAHHANRVDFRNYISGHYSCEDITKEIPEIHDIASIEIEQLANFSSTVITSSHWLQLRKRINQCLNNEGYDGIVITHGTNTLEETAYFLHLTMDTEKPIVLTGAQRPLSGLSSDAHINLLNAVKVASSKDSYGKGVLVALNDQISSARDVAKTNTYRLETFQSGQLGFLGYIDPDNTVQFYRAPTRTHTIQ